MCLLFKIRSKNHLLEAFRGNFSPSELLLLALAFLGFLGNLSALNFKRHTKQNNNKRDRFSGTFSRAHGARESHSGGERPGQQAALGPHRGQRALQGIRVVARGAGGGRPSK